MEAKQDKPNMNVFSYAYIKRARFRFMITLPTILMMVIPAFILDIMATLYQYINFKAYEIPLVNRKKYIIIDRHALQYLNFMEKFYCIYYGYFNGVMQYVSEIAVRTEEFWCPIKHAQKVGFEHKRYSNYLEYGDSTDYHAKWKQIRLKMRRELSEEQNLPD
ncbi:MAG: hypothetical protein AB7S65_02875 [Sulfuricurvum sp.]